MPISIDPSTAKVTLSGILDFEKSGGRYEFVVIATDVTEPFLSGQAILEILVTDSNDQPPIFALSEYFFSVYENSPNGTLVGKLTASDGDSINLDFSLLENSNFFPFIIDTSTGDIYTTDSIDRETNGGFLFEAVVSDGNTFMTVNVTVEILDLNDKNPRSPETIYSFIIPELQAKGFEVGVIPASDDDATVPNNLVGFRIVAGNFDSAFAIEIYSGVISVNDQDAANIMVHPVFDLTVQIYDFGEPSLSSLVDVVITLTDVNNNLPSFPEELYEATIPEDLPTPSLVIQVEAVDLDVAADLTYNFITPVANFMIDQSNGRILVASELDAETRSEYSFTVQVDDGTHVARTSVVVHVSDVNDNAPLFLSNFTNISVSETASIGEVVGKVEAIDIDSDANGIIYSFSEGSSYFAIQSTTGDIFVAQNLETRPENFFQMIVTALDVTPPSDKETEFSFLIEVIDSSKNAPTFNTDIIELSIPEDFAENSTIFVLNATDADDGLGGEIEYTIIGQSDDEFQIDQSNLIFTGQLDYEVQSYYSVIVRAQDFGEVPLSTDVRIIISVENVNDNSPEILNLPAKSLYIPSKNYFFFQVICEDRDINRYDSIGKIEFGLENLEDTFSIDETTGELELSNPPTQTELSLIIFCSDGEFKVNSTLTVTTDQNPSNYLLPKSTNSSRSGAQVRENDESVEELLVLDDVIDVPEDTIPSYNIESSNFDGYEVYFSLTNNGNLWMIQPFDKELLSSGETFTLLVAMHPIGESDKTTYYSVSLYVFYYAYTPKLEKLNCGENSKSWPE